MGELATETDTQTDANKDSFIKIKLAIKVIKHLDMEKGSRQHIQMLGDALIKCAELRANNIQEYILWRRLNPKPYAWNADASRKFIFYKLQETADIISKATVGQNLNELKRGVLEILDESLQFFEHVACSIGNLYDIVFTSLRELDLDETDENFAKAEMVLAGVEEYFSSPSQMLFSNIKGIEESTSGDRFSKTSAKLKETEKQLGQVINDVLAKRPVVP